MIELQIECKPKKINMTLESKGKDMNFSAEGNQDNYNSLIFRPTINGHILVYGMTSYELGLLTHSEFLKSMIQLGLVSNMTNLRDGKGRILVINSKLKKESENGGKPDLTGYATEEYVINAISNMDLSKYAKHSDIPTNLSEMINDKGFITNTVSNLTNYYNKSNCYSKSEINTLIGNITTMSVEIVSSLPANNIKTNTIYLVAKNGSDKDIYNEYLYVNSKWELIGNTAMDLTGYARTEDIPDVSNLVTGDEMQLYVNEMLGVIENGAY